MDLFLFSQHVQVKVPVTCKEYITEATFSHRSPDDCRSRTSPKLFHELQKTQIINFRC